MNEFSESGQYIRPSSAIIIAGHMLIMQARGFRFSRSCSNDIDFPEYPNFFRRGDRGVLSHLDKINIMVLSIGINQEMFRQPEAEGYNGRNQKFCPQR